MKYCQRLRDIREDNDLTQAKVAQHINTTQSYYAQYENGHRSIPFDRIILLAELYNISIDYLAGLTDEPRTIDGKPYHIPRHHSS